MNVTIRQLEPDNWPEWKSVRLEALADAPDVFGSTLSEWMDAPEDRWRARIRDVPFNVIALLDGKAVGQVGATNHGPGGAAELISLWVAPTARGVGVGDALVEAVTSWALSREFRVVELAVKESNGPARCLYERNAFVLTGAGDAGDEVRMMRTLP